MLSLVDLWSKQSKFIESHIVIITNHVLSYYRGTTPGTMRSHWLSILPEASNGTCPERRSVRQCTGVRFEVRPSKEYRNPRQSLSFVFRLGKPFRLQHSRTYLGTTMVHFLRSLSESSQLLEETQASYSCDNSSCWHASITSRRLSITKTIRMFAPDSKCSSWLVL
ncbi:hypothetical protein EI94DRAFT_1786907 [Lactarius quietus]|nr:hypothetical protein EI94DRAFT_1786907 [Lactarius quietus]